MIDFDLPDMPEDITPDWLNTVLSATGTITTDRVADCQTTQIGVGFGGVGRTFRVAITYDNPESGAPRTLVAKLHSKHPQNDRYWGQSGRNAYEKEQRFYRDIAPKTGLRTPTSYLGVTDWEARRSISLVEDLGSLRPGDQLEGGSAEDAITAATDWARFNARFWENDALDSIDSLPSFTDGIDGLQDRFNAAWPAYLARFKDDIPEQAKAIASRLLGTGAKEIRYRLAESPLTLCHGDFHLDNMFFIDQAKDTPPGIVVIDWSGIRKGPGLWDLSHLMCMGFEPEIRRSCEQDVLSSYVQTLAENGVTGYSREQASWDYRLSMLVHFQKLARIHASFEAATGRFAQVRKKLPGRIMSAVLDNFTDDLLP